MSHKPPSDLIHSHAQLEQILRRIGSISSAQECHGILTGQTCRGPSINSLEWVSDIMGDIDPNGPDAVDLAGLLATQLRQIHQQLKGNDMAYSLLPDDEHASLATRVAALRQWCEGFLFGFALGGELSGDDAQDEVLEALEDIRNISLVSIDSTEDAGESGESALVELQEYLRVAVMLIHEQFNPASGQATLAADEHPSLH